MVKYSVVFSNYFCFLQDDDESTSDSSVTSIKETTKPAGKLKFARFFSDLDE